jgi:hypothetical protein
MAAYIDLNPVRAGMVAEPKDYRWSSYGQAVAGKQRAREGIERVVLGRGESSRKGSMPNWRAVARDYRKILYEPLEKDRSREDRAEATVNETEALCGPVRQFTDGLAVGKPPFLESVFLLAQDMFGPRRQSGARKMRGIETELRAMRYLQ